MPVLLTDNEIADLIGEPKPLPDDFRDRIQTRAKRGHRERELDVTGAAGNAFRIILRESSINPLDFSVILAWMPPQSNTLFRLRRYNGKSHEHTNKIEQETFYDFHVHRATERYQKSGLREDAFAEANPRYQDFAGALRSMMEECGFELPSNYQPELFEK